MKYPDELWYYLNKKSLKRTETDELYKMKNSILTG
jgi:hypothetical protein